MYRRVDCAAFARFVAQYPANPFETRGLTHWLDCQKVRHRHVLDTYLEFRPSLNQETPALLDIGAFPGSLVKTLRLFLQEQGRIDGAGLYSPDEFLEELRSHRIGYFPCNFDPLIVEYKAAERTPPTRVDMPDNSYDAVFATEILEHTLDPFYLLREAYRLLRPGGVLVLTTPNQATLSNRLRLLFGKSIYYTLRESIMYTLTEWRPHIREYTHEELSQILRDAGYGIEKATWMDLTDDDPRIWDWKQPALRLAKTLSRPLMCLPPLRHNLLFVGRKPLA